jgi:3-isopropylmalate dehydrogenase
MPHLLLLPGDGIGPEVMAEVVKVIAVLNARFATRISYDQALFGGASIDSHGTPLTDAVLAQALEADGVLMGAVGGPQWAHQDYATRPEAGLLKLRKEMGVFANLRPALCFAPLAESSSLKKHLVEGLDILFVRELVGGVYFGEPRGITTLSNGERRGVNTQVYTSSEIQRVAHVAFQLAASRQGKVCSVEKSNVMETGLLWREEVSALHQAHYPHIALSHMLADNCAMQLVKNPKQFDVILTDNLFGDLLSDEAAMLTGSLGMLPSAALGAQYVSTGQQSTGQQSTGQQRALYEPIHGSAPDIAGQNKANPCAALLSLAMALRYSFNSSAVASTLEHAIENVLAAGIRTADIALANSPSVGTQAMGDAIVAELSRMSS